MRITPTLRVAEASPANTQASKRFFLTLIAQMDPADNARNRLSV